MSEIEKERCKVLIVEDDEAMGEVLRWHVRELGCEAVLVADGHKALEVFDYEAHRIVLLDLRLPGLSGQEVLRRIVEVSKDTCVIVITAFYDIRTAVEAIKAGAFDFIPKPFDKEHLRQALRKALELVTLRKEVKVLEEQIEFGERKIVYASDAMQKVVSLIDKASSIDAPVLLAGESGTGKELLARRLHARSQRRKQKFVALNCAAIPEGLLESEMFGYSKGAFSGAHRDYLGRFVQADKGTLFLDEVFEIPIALQAKLLRAVEEQEVTVLGKVEPIKVDVRIVSATNKDVRQAIKDGKVREDLYFRLSVIEVHVPPLRERREDIVLLARFFLQKWAVDKAPEVSGNALRVLLQYPWPGNVRELENVCRRLYIMCRERGVITEEDVMEALSIQVEKQEKTAFGTILVPQDGKPLDEIEKEAIQIALRRCHGNKSMASRFLSIPRHILLYRMKRLGIGEHQEQGGKER
jgi:two-component system NtrC family response regulator